LPGVLLVLSLATTSSAQRAHPAVTLPGTEVRTLVSASTGKSYDLYVSLPNGFGQTPGRRYPVLYLLDGQWDFKLLTSIQGGLVYDKYTPEMVIVGITYTGPNANYDALRASDYSTVPTAGVQGSGGAPKFLQFLERELMPFMEANYRGDPTRRVLMGSSFGGLFTLYALFTKPALFAGYVAGSPAVQYGERDAFRLEREYAASRKALPARLYLAVGAEEGLRGPTEEMIRVLRDRGYAGLQMQTRIVEDERHSGSKPEIFNRGLRFVFAESMR
jgi:uncharacterized protein